MAFSSFFFRGTANRGAERPSSFFVLSGCAGRSRNEGRKGRSGIACKSYASSSIYPPSNPIRLTRDIVRAVRVYRECSRRFYRCYPEAILSVTGKIIFSGISAVFGLHRNALRTSILKTDFLIYAARLNQNSFAISFLKQSSESKESLPRQNLASDEKFRESRISISNLSIRHLYDSILRRAGDVSLRFSEIAATDSYRNRVMLVERVKSAR